MVKQKPIYTYFIYDLSKSLTGCAGSNRLSPINYENIYINQPKNPNRKLSTKTG